MNNIATTNTAPIKRKRLDDAPFIDALDFAEYRNATTIARHMLANGTPASLATIARRMGEYTAYTTAVEASGKAWRLAVANDDDAPTEPPSPSNNNLSPLALNTLHHGDCLELMKSIPDRSVHLILADLPYGTCGALLNGIDIDIPIDLEALWKEYRRIITPTGNILLFGTQPFSTDLINAGRDWFKYSNIWKKDKPTGGDHARNKPLKDFEEVLVFSPANVAHARKEGGRKSGTTLCRATYNPWRAREVLKVNKPNRNTKAKWTRNIKAYPGKHTFLGLEDCPRMVLEYAKEKVPAGGNPYRKPIPLLDDLIRMYSNAGEVVLDNCVGSGSTVVAAIGAGRQWIAIEQNADCVAEASARIAAAI